MFPHFGFLFCRLSITYAHARKNIPGSPRFSVLQATKNWAGLGNEAIPGSLLLLNYSYDLMGWSSYCSYKPVVPLALQL